MQNLHPDIDLLMQDTATLMTKVNAEYDVLNINPQEDYLKGTAWIGFKIGFDYFMAARQSLIDEHLLSGTSLVRSGLENLGDLFYIYCAPKKQYKYAKAYVESTARYNGVMLIARAKGLDTVSKDRIMKQANKWTEATIEQRLEATGPSILTVYDMMSYFSHPNPAVVTYLQKPKLLHAQINIVKQCNCIAAISLMGLSINHANINNIEYTELNEISTKLGFPLMQSLAVN